MSTCSRWHPRCTGDRRRRRLPVGHAPPIRSQRCSAMKKWCAIAALLVFAAPAFAADPHTRARPVETAPEGGGPGGIYGGGPHTLPYGVMSGQLVLEHAHAMAFIQTAIAEMQRRGYLRRVDLDL